MRLIFVFLFAILCSSYSQSEHDKTSDVTENTYQVSVADLSRVCINCLRKLFKHGSNVLPILPIPPLDPLNIKEFPLKLDSDNARGDLRLSNITISKFSNFVVDEIKENEVCFIDNGKGEQGSEDDVKEWKTGRANKNYFNRVRFTLMLETDYVADLNLMGFVPVFGEGHITTLMVLKLTTSMLDVGTSAVQITDFEACLEMDPELNLGITGLQGDEHISSILTKQLTQLLPLGVNEEYRKGISNQLVIIKTIINKAFGSKFVNDLLYFILNPLCGADEELI